MREAKINYNFIIYDILFPHQHPGKVNPLIVLDSSFIDLESFNFCTIPPTLQINIFSNSDKDLIKDKGKEREKGRKPVIMCLKPRLF